MKAIKHHIKHYYRPTNFGCGQASAAILLSHYGKDITPAEVNKIIPTLKNAAGENWGTLAQQQAKWCLSLGFDVDFYSGDFEVLDLSWRDFSREKLLERMKFVKSKRNVPSLGQEFSALMMQTNIDFVEAGGNLHIVPYMNTKLINELLEKGPIAVSLSYVVLHGEGRYQNLGPREAPPDDVNGMASNHAVVLYGRDEDGNYLIADPMKEPGHFALEPEHLLCAMTAAQTECENSMYVIAPKP